MDNQVSTPPVTIQQKSDLTETAISSNSNPITSKSIENEKLKSVEEAHKPIAPFPNRLKSNKSNA